MSNPKITNPGWPDPNDWIGRLHREMAERQAIYDLETDPLLQRNKAGAILGVVVERLMELPSFKSTAELLALKDLLIFLNDLDDGIAHPWSKPVNYGGTSAATTAEREIRRWVRAANRLLRDHGYETVEAYRHIARGLTTTGRKSRQGNPITWKLVRDWCQKAETPYDLPIRLKLERWWTQTRATSAEASAGTGLGKATSEKQTVGSFVDDCWRLSHLRG
jgi:hypothetical protein